MKMKNLFLIALSMLMFCIVGMANPMGDNAHIDKSAIVVVDNSFIDYTVALEEKQIVIINVSDIQYKYFETAIELYSYEVENNTTEIQDANYCNKKGEVLTIYSSIINCDISFTAETLINSFEENHIFIEGYEVLICQMQ